MGRKCYQIGLKEDGLGKKDNLWVENFIWVEGIFCEENIFEKLSRLFVQN